MATIKDAYDLTGGNSVSTAVANVTNLTVHWVWGGTQAGSVKLVIKAKEGSGNYVPVKNANGVPFEKTLYVERSEQAEDRWTVFGIHSSSAIVSIEPSDDATGTMSLYTYES